MKSKLLPVIGLCVAALLAGFAARRMCGGLAAPQTGKAEAPSTSPPVVKVTPNFPPLHSTDTAETLSVLDVENLYARLALWLVDASEPEIAEFWRGYSEHWGHSEEIIHLILLNWTRLDPRRAIAGAGSKYDLYSWEAWACIDPQASLDAAIADAPDMLDYVVRRVARFHPDWLLRYFEEIPETARGSAIEGMAESESTENPSDLLKFLKEHADQVNPAALVVLAREDPWAAIEWARANPKSDDPFADETTALTTVIQILADNSPDELASIAERTPSGKARLEMEAALFANLLKADPAAALEQAKSATVPRTAAERYAAIGLSVVHTDPEQAVQIAKDLFAACPDALRLTASIEYPEGGYTQYLDIPGVSEFLDSLMTRQPEKVMEMIASLPPESLDWQFESFSDEWIEQDLAGYANWVNQQAKLDIRRSGASLIAEELHRSGNYQEAAEWASSMDITDTGQLGSILETWQKDAPEAPARWLEITDLPPDRKAVIQSLLDSPQ